MHVYVAAFLQLSPLIPSTEQLLYALTMLGLTLGFGIALTAMLFYNLQKRPTVSQKGNRSSGTPASLPPQRRASRTSTGSVVSPARTRPTTRTPSSSAGAPAVSTRRTSRQISPNSQKQLKYFEKLLSNLEREYQQGTVSATIYKKLKSEYQERIKNIRSGR